MRDLVEIRVNDTVINDFLSYSIPSSIFIASEEFSFTFAFGLVEVNKGDLIKCFVNNELELTGIIETIEDDISKGAYALKITGRDVLSMAAETSIEDFTSKNGQDFEKVVTDIIKKIDVLKRSSLSFEGKSAKISKKFSKAEIGTTNFDRLKRLSTSKGLLFFADPDGTIVFGRVPTNPKEDFKIYLSKDNDYKVIISSKRRITIKGQHSKATVLGQSNGGENYKKTYELKDLPFNKPFVGQLNEDGDSAQSQAKTLLENERKDALILTYLVIGHSQDGKNFKTRKGVRVKDDIRGIDKTLLITSRVMSMDSKSSGQKTEITLGSYAER